MKKYKSAKVTGIIFAVLIFSLVVNILYLGATGKHLISGENIASFAKNRSKKEVVEYVVGLNMLKEGKFIHVTMKK